MAESNGMGLESLQVWQRSLAFAESVYKLALPLLPAGEKWGLASQLRRMLNGYIAFLKRSKRGEYEPGSATSIREDSVPYFSDPDS
jgi:hypothetical protein